MSLAPALSQSLDLAHSAWLAGYAAEDKGQAPNACPYAPCQAMLREQWMKGYRASARDRKVATE